MVDVDALVLPTNGPGRRMNITIVQGAFLPVPPIRGGAVEKVWGTLAREFASRGHTVTHISRRFEGLLNDDFEDGVHHVRVRGFETPKSLLVLKFLDLIYSRRVLRILPSADILVTNTFWLPILKRHNDRGQLYVHVARFPKGQMRLYRHAARIQTVSTHIAAAIAKEIPSYSSKVTVIHYPISHNAGSVEIDDWSSRENVILYVGRVHPEKGLHILIQAFSQLLTQLGPSWGLRIVGPWRTEEGGGGLRYYEHLLAMSAPFRERVELTGPVYDNSQLESKYRSAKIFVYPSLAEKGETFGLAPLEAMNMGCPVVVSELECFRDFVINGRNGFYFNHRAGDPPNELASRLTSLASNETLLQAAGAAALQTAREFDYRLIATRYLEDFEKVLHESNMSVSPTTD